MTLINGHFYHPLWVSLLQGAGQGLKPAVVGVTQSTFDINSSTWTKLLDKATGGPYLVVLVNEDPAETQTCEVRLVGDGTILHERLLYPSGGNFLIGTPFSEQVGTYSTPAVWCHTGFEIWGKRAVATTITIEYIYYELSWETI